MLTLFIESIYKFNTHISINLFRITQLVKYLLFLFVLTNTVNSQASTVIVSKYFENQYQIITTVEPTRIATFALGDFRKGDKIAFQVLVSNKMYRDITVCLISKSEISTWKSGNSCIGQQKALAPFAYQTELTLDDAYYLAIDNSYANIIKKFVTVNVKTRYVVSEEKSTKIKQLFQGTTNFVETAFEDSDLDVSIRPCGQANAFSDAKTANITFCTEMLDDLLSNNNIPSIIAIFLHELGHSLLNRWGEPGSSEEDMADQFATAILLKGGDQGRSILKQWSEFWASRDSKREAELQLKYDDTHSLSIQRARNIQRNMLQQDEFLRRWNKMLYRHMKKDILLKIANKPGHSDDADLASEALKGK